jgi:hypothetical protein
MTTSIPLKSTVENIGDTCTQIIHFVGEVKRTVTNIKTKTIKQGELTKFATSDGRMIMVNTRNVLMIEVFAQDSVAGQNTDSTTKPSPIETA